MTSPTPPKADVDALAAAIGLPIPPAHRTNVQRTFDQLAVTAALVMSFPLEPGIEPATIYRNDRP
jgi:Protein of unknown function (DUF4089)